MKSARPFFSTLIKKHRHYPQNGDYIETPHDESIDIDDLPDNAILKFRWKGQIVYWYYVGQIKEHYEKLERKWYGKKSEIPENIKRML